MDHNGAERPIAPTALGWYRPKRCWCPQRDVARWLRTALDYVRLSCVANLFSVQFSSSLPTTRRHRSSSNQQIQMAAWPGLYRTSPRTPRSVSRPLATLSSTRSRGLLLQLRKQTARMKNETYTQKQYGSPAHRIPSNSRLHISRQAITPVGVTARSRLEGRGFG